MLIINTQEEKDRIISTNRYYNLYIDSDLCDRIMEIKVHINCYNSTLVYIIKNYLDIHKDIELDIIENNLNSDNNILLAFELIYLHYKNNYKIS